MSWQRFDNGRLTEQGDDATRTVTTYDEQGNVTSTRPYTDDENAQADEAIALAARVDDHETRIARIETHLWPAPPDPTEPTAAPEWGDLEPAGWWPNGGLLLDVDGVVYRNTSGTVLTTPPSGFPGPREEWMPRLFVVALAPNPTTPDGYVGPWSAQATYAVDDVVDKDGRYWKCLTPHGPERQGTWAPSQFTPTIWTDLGPV